MGEEPQLIRAANLCPRRNPQTRVMLSVAKHLNPCVLARASLIELSSTFNVETLRFAQDDQPLSYGPSVCCGIGASGIGPEEKLKAPPSKTEGWAPRIVRGFCRPGHPPKSILSPNSSEFLNVKVAAAS